MWEEGRHMPLKVGPWWLLQQSASSLTFFLLKVDSDPPLLWYARVLVSPFQWRQCERRDPPCLPILDSKRACSLHLAGSWVSCLLTGPPCCKEAQATWSDLSMCFVHIHPLHSLFSFLCRRKLTPKFLESGGDIRQDLLIPKTLGLFCEIHSKHSWYSSWRQH